jgi:hypothetical protein
LKEKEKVIELEVVITRLHTKTGCKSAPYKSSHLILSKKDISDAAGTCPLLQRYSQTKTGINIERTTTR